MNIRFPTHSAREAMTQIKSHQRVFIHSAAASPQTLIKELVARKEELRAVEIVQIHTEGDAPYTHESCRDSFKVNSFFIGQSVRPALATGMADYIPVFLSEIPDLFRKRILAPDVSLIQVSPPDQRGLCSLGPSVDISLAAVECSQTIIAQINPHMPRTHGHAHIPYSRINYAVDVNDPLPEISCPAPTPEEMQIGHYVASLIEDGSTLQLGIGSIPNAVLSSLTHHRDLGIHSEMFSDGVATLAEKGVITGKYKSKHPGKIVSSFVVGTRKVYDFIHDHPNVLLLDCAYTNDTSVIRRNPKVVAINSAIEVDFSGQVCADSIGHKIFSGVGGQMDFIRGAALSDGGKPVIALTSTTRKGESKIVPFLRNGAGVVTTRAHVRYVVTEYGIADLYGKNLRERAKLLINIAHPNHRESLDQAWHAQMES